MALNILHQEQDTRKLILTKLILYKKLILMKKILIAAIILITLTNSTIFAQRVFVFDLDKYVNINEFKDNVKDDKNGYSGIYTCLLFAATDEMDANWDELIIEVMNDEVNASLIFYMEAEPQPPISLLNVSIKENYFKAQNYNVDEKKYDNYSGRFVYFIDSQSGRQIYGILIKQKNFNSQYELFFYAKK